MLASIAFCSLAECVDIVGASGPPNETNVMFTNVEAEWDEVMGVLECVDHVAMATPRRQPGRQGGPPQVVSGALRSKVESVERHCRRSDSGNRSERRDQHRCPRCRVVTSTSES